MSNKTELQNNNLELSEILGDINALPDAGGGSAPTLVEVTACSYHGGTLTIGYTAYENGEIVFKEQELSTNGSNAVIYCVDKTVMVVTSEGSNISCDGRSNGLEYIYGEYTPCAVYIVNSEVEGTELMIDWS